LRRGAALAEATGMRIASLLAILCLSACSIFMHSIERPTAQVRDVAISNAGFTGVRGQLALDVTNPNSFGVPLQRIDWELSIGGVRAATGEVELSQTIPAKAAVPITTSLAIDARDAIGVASRLAGGARGYELKATLRFGTPVGPLDIAIDHGGELGSIASL